jgi:hypothetical protein
LVGEAGGQAADGVAKTAASHRTVAQLCSFDRMAKGLRRIVHKHRPPHFLIGWAAR